MILWITGISGSGKTTLAKYFFKHFKKKHKNTIFLDGDEFRSLFSNDLKYTIKDRDKNAERMTAFVKYLSNQNINLVISANITSQKYRNWCKKNLKNFVQICRTTPCWLRGSDKLSQVAQEVCETKIGETSDDKKFTVVEVECLGACCNAPMVQINDDYYEELNEESFKKLLQDMKDNKSLKVGSQIGRKSSQPERKFDA